MVPFNLGYTLGEKCSKVVRWFLFHLLDKSTGIPSVRSVHSHISQARVPGMAKDHSPASPYMKVKTHLELLRSYSSPGDEAVQGDVPPYLGRCQPGVLFTQHHFWGQLLWSLHIVSIHCVEARNLNSLDHRTLICPILMHRSFTVHVVPWHNFCCEHWWSWKVLKYRQIFNKHVMIFEL